MMTIDKSRCVECGACITVCPRGIFVREAGEVRALDLECLDCFHCAAACPTEAIGCDKLEGVDLYPPLSDNATLRFQQLNRRSIRHYTDEIPSQEELKQALDGTMYAPSAKNQHPAHWIVVRSKEVMDKIFRLTMDWVENEIHDTVLLQSVKEGRNPLTCGASCAIFGVARPEAWNPPVDTTLALSLAENILVEKGWATCWAGYLQRSAHACPPVRELLGIPEGYKVCVALLVGKADGERYLRAPYRPAASVAWVE